MRSLVTKSVCRLEHWKYWNIILSHINSEEYVLLNVGRLKLAIYSTIFTVYSNDRLENHDSD